jgi:transcriptional regulator with XRE-family HTH domain
MTAGAPQHGTGPGAVEQWRRGVSIGAALAEARGRAGLTVAEVSQRTRIREAVIARIEDDDYSACGGDFYARGNIRGIAAAVGADPEPLIREYDEVHRAPGVLSAVSLDELLTPAQAPGRRHRLNWTAVLALALALAVTLGAVAYSLRSGSPHAAGTPPAAAHHVVTGAGRSETLQTLKTSRSAARYSAAAARPTVAARAATGPAATVRAYVAAINGRHYARAWRLGGKNAGGSYSSFVGGFGTTARDTLTIVAVSGDVVTGRLTAQQTDGTVTAYQGTYTVQRGVITGFDVLQVG